MSKNFDRHDGRNLTYHNRFGAKSANYKNRQSKSRERYEIMKKEIEEKFIKEHPFKPEINYNILTRNETEEERLKRLSKPKAIEIKERMRQKEIEEENKIKEFAKFQPNTKNLNPNSVAERLFSYHQEIKRKKEMLKREFEENALKEYSFAPEINTQSKILMNKYEQLPLYERCEKFEKAKNENLIKKRMELEKEQKMHEKPQISQKSKELANLKKPNDGQDIFTRLYNENLRDEKYEKEKYLSNQLDQCTFSPQIGTSQNNDFLDGAGNIDDFLERQKVYEQIKRDRLERKVLKNNQKEECTFKPKINLTSDILMKTNSSRANENLQDKIDRLYKQDYEKIQNRKEQLESFYNAQYDYKPKINELSKFIGREANVTDLNRRSSDAYNPKGSNSTSFMGKSQASFYDSECTFQPKMFTNSKYDYVKSNYKADETILNRINDEVKQKNEKITGLQNALEKKDIAECKFKPEINKNAPNFENNKPMLMKGMSRYLEQMEKARKAKRDKEEREKEVFITGENWSRDNLITVPKPFKLSYQNAKKKDEAKRDRECQEMKECTFKPKTNESKNREIIKQLLKD